MSQTNVDFSDNPTGSELMDNYLAKEQENSLTSNSGVQRPSYAKAGTKWLDTSSEPWALKMYTGSGDVVIGYIDKTKGTFKPVNALPELQGQNGKYLTTDGETSFWGVLDLSSKANISLDNINSAGQSKISTVVEVTVDGKFKVVSSLPDSIVEGVYYFIAGDEQKTTSYIPDYTKYTDISDNTYTAKQDGWIFWRGAGSGGTVDVNGVLVGTAGNYTDQPFAQFMVGQGDVITCNNKTYFRFIPFKG